jgi:hypothetical protein
MIRRGAAVGTVLLLIFLLLGGIPLRSVWAQSVPSSQTWELLRPASDTASSPSSGAKGAIRQRAVRVDAAAFGEEGVQRGDTLALNFFAKAAFRGRVRAVERPTAATTVLRGTLDGGPVSTFSVAHTAGRVHVVAMTAEGNTYEVRYDAARSTHVATQYDRAGFAEACRGGLAPDAVGRSLADDVGRTAANGVDDPATIDVMVVYTPAADAWADLNSSGIDNVIAQAMSLADQALVNSNVGISVRLVHTAVIDYTESGNTGTDLQRLTSREDGYMDAVHAMRDAYGADLVALFAEVNDVGGLAWILNNEAGRSSLGFSITRVQQAARSFTHAHEMGHNMGNAHSRNQRSNAAGPGGGLFEYSTGWRWAGTDGVQYASVMTYADGDRKAPLFSNPEVDWAGTPSGSYTGAYAPADNARSMREVKHAIASYRRSPVQPPQFQAGRVDPPSGTPRDAFTFRVDYQSDEGVAPDAVQLHLNGTAYNLNANSFDWTDGVTFSIVRDVLSVGRYDYYFTADVGGDVLREPASGTYALDVTNAAVDLPLTVRDGDTTRTLRFGLDPAATSALDADLSEDELGPFPAEEAFAARFVGDALGAGSYRDYRPGTPTTDAQVEHEVRFQSGSGAPVTLAWDLPNRVTGRLEDLNGGAVIDASMQGTDSLTIADASIDRLRMTVTYALGGNQPPTVARPIGNRLIQLETADFVTELDTVFTEPDGDPLAYTVSSSDPNVAAVELAGQYLRITPREAGSTSISVKADDGRGGTAEDRFALDVNAAPLVLRALSDALLQLDDAPLAIGVDSVLADPDGDSLRYALTIQDEAVVEPVWEGATLRLAPKQAGRTDVVLAAEDGRGGSARNAFAVRVNAPPSVVRPIDALVLQVDGAPFVADLDTVFQSPGGSSLSFTATPDDGELVETELNGTTLTVTPHQAGTTSLQLTARDTLGGATNTTLPLAVNTPPAVVGPLPDQRLTDAQSTLTVQLDTVFTDADEDPLTYTVQSQLPVVADAQLDDGLLTVRSRTAGTAPLEVLATDGNAGRAVATFSVTVSTSFGVDIAQSFGPVDEAQNYRLVALPGRADRPLAATVAGEYDQQWRAFWDNGRPGPESEYLVEHDGSSTFQFRPGRGFWLISEDPWSVSTRTEAVPLADDGTYPLPLHDGWNIIANPFDQAVAWRAVQDANGVTETLWQWNGAFNQTATLNSAATGQAYYFFNDPDQGRSTLRIPYPSQSAAPAKRQASAEAPWAAAVDVSARTPNGHVSRIRMGRVSDAPQRTDAYRRVAPPGHFGTVRLGIHEEAFPWMLAQAAMSGPDGDGHHFRFQLAAQTEAPVTLQARLHGADATQHAVLRREDTGRTYPIDPRSTVQVRARPEGATWSLFVGTADYVQAQTVPATLELRPNYPNPFREATTIVYAVPEAMDVELAVYNVLGQRVATLADGEKIPGVHRVRWDGQARGAALASGVYFVRLRANGTSHVEQMTLVR